jgi:hypothetical protein
VIDDQARVNVDQRIRDTWNRTPDTITVTDALAMDWGGERNLALRRAVGMAPPWQSGETCLVNMAGVIQLTVATGKRARQLADKLEAALPRDGWRVQVTKRPDGLQLVTAHPDTPGQP